MKKIITLLICLITLANCQENKTPEQIQAEQISFKINSEKQFASSYVKTNGTYRKRLLHNGFEMNFEIKNTSKYTTYKDIVIEVSYFSNSETKINNETITIYEILKPNQTIKISKNSNKHLTSDVKKVGFNTVNATVKS